MIRLFDTCCPLASAKTASALALLLLLVFVPPPSKALHADQTGSAPSGVTDVPHWAKSAIWYQIFPERFRNGDRQNDPTLTDIAGSWPHETPREWSVSVWTGDWYELQAWEVADGKDFYYRAQQRRYGGDLQGVLDKLDYLTDLGISAIYFNPLFEAPSLHKYDASMYHHIDNNFGPDPEGDKAIWATEEPANPATWRWTSADRLFLKLIEEAHKRNIKIIIDGVFNHVGMTHWAFLDVRKNGERSAFKDWFTIKRWDDPATPEDEFDYAGWYGVRELPEIREDVDGLVDGPRQHVRDIVKRWMDPNGDGDPSDGIDGWRLDVAEMVAIPFWREFRSWVRSINSNAYIVGEVWWEDWANDKMFNASPWLEGDVFDAVMNYRWARETGHFFKDRKNKISPSEFSKRLAALRSDYRSEANYVLMKLMDSHDTDRLASQIVNVDTRYDHSVSPKDDRNYDVRKPNPDEIRILKLIALFQMTYVGAPTIYYGTESGMWGADDPDDRKPMLWGDMKYKNERSHPLGLPRPDDVNEFNTELFNHYKKLIGIRKSNSSLSLGEYSTLLVDDEADVFSFQRSFGNEHVVVVINNSVSTRNTAIPFRPTARWTNLWDSADPVATGDGIRVELAPKSGAILKADLQ